MSSHVLVLNAGSSSLKYSLVDGDTGAPLGGGTVERIGEENGRLSHRGPGGSFADERRFGTHEEALRAAVEAFETHGPSLADTPLAAVGHRVVHGGDRFAAPAVVDDELMEAVRDLVPLAPLHNPANLEGMAVARTILPTVPHVAVFDTAFHQTLPEHAYTYAVPLAWRDDHAIRRYGFHGTSHRFVAVEAARLLGRPPEDVNLIVLHLGNGASATAVCNGRSVDTSMGLTPLEGLVMGTRSGDVDPALHAHLHRELGWSLDDVDRRLNQESGLKGLTGHNDFREVMRLREEGDVGARLAFDVYAYRIRKYVGAYYAVLGSVDAVVFTAGVGQHSSELRRAALTGLGRLGILLDEERNAAEVDGPTVVSSAGSGVAVLVIPTDEEWEIARQTLALLR